VSSRFHGGMLALTIALIQDDYGLESVFRDGKTGSSISWKVEGKFHPTQSFLCGAPRLASAAPSFPSPSFTLPPYKSSQQLIRR